MIYLILLLVVIACNACHREKFTSVWTNPITLTHIVRGNKPETYPVHFQLVSASDEMIAGYQQETLFHGPPDTILSDRIRVSTPFTSQSSGFSSLTPDSVLAIDPLIVSGGDGSFYTFWGQRSDTTLTKAYKAGNFATDVMVSRWNNGQWSRPIDLYHLGGEEPNEIDLYDFHGVADSQHRVHIVFVSKGKLPPEVMYTSGRGQIWQPTQRLFRGLDPDIAIGSDGHMLLTFAIFDTTLHKFNINSIFFL